MRSGHGPPSVLRRGRDDVADGKAAAAVEAALEEEAPMEAQRARRRDGRILPVLRRRPVHVPVRAGCRGMGASGTESGSRDSLMGKGGVEEDMICYDMFYQYGCI